MDRKEKILKFISSREYIPLTFSEFCVVLDVPNKDHEQLLGILNELEDEEKIVNTKKGKYVSVKKDPRKVIGTLRCNERGFFGFLIPDEEGESDVYISGENFANALDSDRVLVQVDIVKSLGGRREGHVIKVLERKNTSLTGVVEAKKKDTFIIKCDRERIFEKIRVRAEDMQEAQIGERVIVEITRYSDNGHIWGMVTKVIGDAKALSGYVETIIFDHGIEQEFPQEVIDQVDKIGDSIDEKDTVGREDLRGKIVFTIDGENARDFDDAVSIEQLDNGNSVLGVHIADVTNYVTEGSALDKCAFERSTSVYLADRVIPMIPKKLSNGICSLNPNVDRLTLSVFMEIDKDGNIVNNSLKKSVICSTERMTYTDVTKLLEGSDEKLLKKYEYILPDLKKMGELAAILRKKRMERGSIDFNFAESNVVVNEMGEPVDIVKVEREVSHKLIEEFMLAANETVAEYAFWSELPFVYRVHEAPDGEKIQAFNDFVSNFGLKIKGKIDSEDTVHPKSLQQILAKVAGEPEEFMISTYLLRSLMKAKYSPNNLGHFGLAAKYYAHFTSPIRRYPDLAIHRILKEFIGGGLSQKRISQLKHFVAEASVQSTERQNEADVCERDVNDLMKAAYMSQFIGQTFEGVISSVLSFGIFVELDNSVEGLIRVDQMNKDYYIFNETKKQLIGERTGRIYKIGDRVEIVLVRTDLLSRQIDFLLLEDASKRNIERVQKFAVKKKVEKEFKIKQSQIDKKNKANGLRCGVKKALKKKR